MKHLIEITGEQKLAITTAMARHTAPFIAAIELIVAEEWNDTGDGPSALPCATGCYVELQGRPYILTNEHVAKKRLQYGLAHALRHASDPNGKAFRVINPFQSVAFPVDAAISRIEEEVWVQGQRHAIRSSRIAHRHAPAHGERLFLHGYPGALTHSSSFVGGMHATSVPFLTEECELPPGFAPNTFFALHYSPERATAAGHRSFTLPVPGGFSGTPVWNTHYVSMLGQDWAAEQALVTGLACAWPQGEYADRLLVVRIEVVREFLIHALRREAAYFHWLQRGQQGGDDWHDWYRAVDEIQDIACQGGG